MLLVVRRHFSISLSCCIFVQNALNSKKLQTFAYRILTVFEYKIFKCERFGEPSILNTVRKLFKLKFHPFFWLILVCYGSYTRLCSVHQYFRV